MATFRNRKAAIDYVNKVLGTKASDTTIAVGKLLQAANHVKTFCSKLPGILPSLRFFESSLVSTRCALCLMQQMHRRNSTWRVASARDSSRQIVDRC